MRHNVHIIKMIEIKKNYLRGMLIKKCSQAFQTAFHSRTIKSMDNEQLRWIESTTDANVKVTHARLQLGVNSQWLRLWPVTNNLLCQTTETGDQSLDCIGSIRRHISRFVEMKRERVVSTCNHSQQNTSAYCKHEVKYSSLQLASPLWELTCHIGSHSTLQDTALLHITSYAIQEVNYNCSKN